MFPVNGELDSRLKKILTLVKTCPRPDARRTVSRRRSTAATSCSRRPGSYAGAAAGARLLDACRDDPARFQEEVLGRRLWAKQVEVCQAIARSPITVVPAGRAVGKSFLLAGTVLWWLYTRPEEPGDHHRARPSPGGLGALEGDPPGTSAALEQAGRDSPGLVLGHDHLTAGYNSPQRLVGEAWGPTGVPWASRRSTRRASAGSTPATCS